MALNNRYQGVTAFTGMPGSGKTYSLAEIAARELRRGVPVFTNGGFDVAGCEQFSTFEDFCAITTGVILWDELPLYVNSRKWSEFPDGLLYKFTQIRKDQVRLYYSAMDEGMVDLNIRRVTFWYVNCRAVTGRWLRRETWPPGEYRKKKARPVKREWVHVRKEITGLYDTYGKVEVPEETHKRVAAISSVRWAKVTPAVSRREQR